MRLSKLSFLALVGTAIVTVHTSPVSAGSSEQDVIEAAEAVVSQPNDTAAVRRLDVAVEDATGVDPELEATTTTRRVVVASALTQLDARYQHAAASPGAFDCSGLISWAWGQVGVDVPAQSGAQHDVGTATDNPQPGDVAWRSGHVALVVADDLIVHAASESADMVLIAVDLDTDYSAVVDVSG